MFACSLKRNWMYKNTESEGAKRERDWEDETKRNDERCGNAAEERGMCFVLYLSTISG